MSHIAFEVGDFVFFDTSPTSPCAIRKIHEFIKTEGGWVDVKVQCFYRRTDLPANNLITVADKHMRTIQESSRKNGESLTDIQWHQLKHRELFLAYQYEYLSADTIRGKCFVAYLCEVESLSSYLNNDDMFFYRMVYDPVQKNLLVAQKEIRLGSKYQAVLPQFVGDKYEEEKENDEEKSYNLETQLWTPNHNMPDNQIKQFLIVARSVGTFARALSMSPVDDNPRIRLAASMASRDVTQLRAHDILFSSNFNMADAMCSLIPSTGPILCRDELEEWSSSETKLFEEAIQTYGKHFNEIREDILPWKSLKNVVEYYYSWKTSDSYLKHKKKKLAENKNKIKTLRVSLEDSRCAFKWNVDSSGSGIWKEYNNYFVCVSCANALKGLCFVWKENKMCRNCWVYWKKYGGLKTPSKICLPDTTSSQNSNRCLFASCLKSFDSKLLLARHYALTHRVEIRHHMPSRKATVRKLHPFYFHTTLFNRISRRLCQRIVRPRRAARKPFKPINVALVRQECSNQMSKKAVQELLDLLTSQQRSHDTSPTITDCLNIQEAISLDFSD